MFLSKTGGIESLIRRTARRRGNGSKIAVLMTSSKVSGPLSELKSRAEAENILNQVAHMMGLLECATSLRDQEVLQVQARHQLVIEQLTRDIAANKELLEAWAWKNRKAEFGETKTLKLPDGDIYFRMGQRRLVFLAEWTEELSLVKILSFPADSQWHEYVRREPTLDKRKLLLDTSGESPRLGPSRLKTIGLEVTRDERFNWEVRPGPAKFENKASAL